jgi:hypothetical protein
VTSFEELRQKYPEREPEKESAQDSALVYLGMYSKDLLNRLWEGNRKLKDLLQEANNATGAVIGIPEGDLTVGRPMQKEPEVEDINETVVDNWNEVALKNLGQGEETAFYEIGKLVIINANKREQPYLYWARGQNEVNREAKMILTKKGGAFDPGLITAVGV